MTYQKTGLPVGRKRTGKTLICEACATPFYVTISRISYATKKGAVTRYCSQKCRVANMSGERNPFFGKTHSKDSLIAMAAHPNRKYFGTGPNNPNAKKYGHWFGYKSASKYLRSTITECQICGWGVRPEVLQIHHIDRNRLNNSLENVKLICPNCHSISHYDAKDGHYIRLGKGKK
jgi:5-methylcytosine-specific restriction endonuclease McrA